MGFVMQDGVRFPDQLEHQDIYWMILKQEMADPYRRNESVNELNDLLAEIIY